MKLLKDTNSEVQGMAMKCLAPLTAFVETLQASYIVDKLLDHVVDGDALKPSAGSPENIGVKAMRDVSSISLKSILAELPPESQKAVIISKSIAPRLVLTIRSTKATGDTVDVLIEAFELLYDILNRMGILLADHHDDICDAILRQLPSSSAIIAKRAISCLGALAATSENSLFTRIVNKAISDLQTQPSRTVIRTSVQIIWRLSRTSGHRLAVHVPVLVPILFNYCSSEIYKEDDELREHCMETLASFCLRCRREMIPFGSTLANCVVILAKYDPNYVEDDDNDEDQDDNGDEMGQDVEDMDEFDEDDDYSDDDDSSWKVRRAAIRCVHAITSVELLPRAELFSRFGPFLITRFKEREESVKLDVFDAFSELLRLAGSMTKGFSAASATIRAEADVGDAMIVDADEEVRNQVSPLLLRGPGIVKSLKKELGSKSLKARTKAMTLLRNLVNTMPSVILPLIGNVIPEIEQGLRDSSTAMKTESLLLLRSVMAGGGAEALKDDIGVLIPQVIATTGDRYYKITAECLRCCGEALIAFGTASPACKENMSPLAPGIHDSALKRVTAQDQDSEVKEAALLCLGGTVSYFGSVLGSDRLSKITPVLVDRLGNEMTRLATVRALSAISRSGASNVLCTMMAEITETVGGFLRKNNSSLKVAALDMLSVAPVLPSKNDSALVANVSELVTDSDLRITRMSLLLMARLIQMRGSGIVGEVAKSNSVYQRAIGLTLSSLLQGAAVDALIEFFRTLAYVNAIPLTVEAMLTDLITQAGELALMMTASTTRTSSPLHTVARCVVALCEAADATVRTQIREQIIMEIASNDTKRRIFSLVCLGEFGRCSRIIKSDEEKQRARDSVLAALEASEDEVRTAAALAMGGISATDGTNGVLTLVDLIRQQPRQKYLLLLSMKDTIWSSSNIDLGQVVQVLLPLLLQPTSVSDSGFSNLDSHVGGGKQASEQDSVRTATAECLGLLTQAGPDVLMPKLVEGAKSMHSDVRASVAAAIKFAMASNSDNGPALAKSLKVAVNIFVQLIGDDDVFVAKNALQAVNAIAKSRPSLLAPHLTTVQQLVFARLVKNKDFVRIVDLGPFKHEEDYGLDMRKSAFDCMRTFVSGPLCTSLQLTTLVEHTLVGFADQSDVRAIAQLILATAAATPGAAQLVTIIEPILKALEMTFNEKVKPNAVRQETERHDESIRGALRAIRMLETVPEIAQNRRFQSFMSSVVRTSKYVEKYEAIGQKDVELMTIGGMTGAESVLAQDMDDVIMAD